MKFKIDGLEDKESIIELSLHGSGNGNIKVVGKQRSGMTTNILCFSNDGKFYRYRAADLDGLATDFNGNIVEMPEPD